MQPAKEMVFLSDRKLTKVLGAITEEEQMPTMEEQAHGRVEPRVASDEYHNAHVAQKGEGVDEQRQHKESCRRLRSVAQALENELGHPGAILLCHPGLHIYRGRRQPEM